MSCPNMMQVLFCFGNFQTQESAFSVKHVQCIVLLPKNNQHTEVGRLSADFQSIQYFNRYQKSQHIFQDKCVHI